MREIKFRVWDKNKSLMVNNVNILLLDEYKAYPHARSYMHNCTDWEEFDLINDPIFMQYTGLKDNNGKEIYEGDIIKSFFADGKWALQTIVFHEGGFKYLFKDSPYSEPSSMSQSWLNDFKKEVLGNVYENAELINP